MVAVEFVSGHLRNDLRSEDSFLYVEKLNENYDKKVSDESWSIISVDGDMETQLQWIRTNAILGQSKVQVRWTIPSDTPSGTYRIRHVGKFKVQIIPLMTYFTLVIRIILFDKELNPYIIFSAPTIWPDRLRRNDKYFYGK